MQVNSPVAGRNSEREVCSLVLPGPSVRGCGSMRLSSGQYAVPWLAYNL